MCWMAPDLLTAERMGGGKNEHIIVRLRPITGLRIGCGLLPNELAEREKHFLFALIRFELVVHSDFLCQINQPVKFEDKDDGSVGWNRLYKPAAESFTIPEFEPTAPVGGHLSPIPRGRTTDSPCGPVANLMARVRSQSPLRTLHPIAESSDVFGGGALYAPSSNGTPVRTRRGTATPRGGGSSMFSITSSNEFPLSRTSPAPRGLSTPSNLYRQQAYSPLPRTPLLLARRGSASSPLPRVQSSTPGGTRNTPSITQRRGCVVDKSNIANDDDDGDEQCPARRSPVLKRKRTSPPGCAFASPSYALSDLGEGAAKRRPPTTGGSSRPELVTPVPRGHRGTLSSKSVSSPIPLLDDYLDANNSKNGEKPLPGTPLHFPLSSPIAPRGTPCRASQAPALDPQAETPLLEGRSRGVGCVTEAIEVTPIVMGRNRGESGEAVVAEDCWDSLGRHQQDEIVADQLGVELEAKEKLRQLPTGDLTDEIYRSYFGTTAKTISHGMKQLALKAERNKEIKEVKLILDGHAERFRQLATYHHNCKKVLRALEQRYFGKERVATRIGAVAASLVDEDAFTGLTAEELTDIITRLGQQYPHIVKIEQSALREVQCVSLETDDATFDETYDIIEDLAEDAKCALKQFCDVQHKILAPFVASDDLEENSGAASANNPIISTRGPSISAATVGSAYR
eukprot:GHVS01022259.1.p1 GENE.GHVS01022259.1~~GHVS01022259.1.p1  ORF type:complete len:683 (+),score=85.97 GHVS01022259.1:249-2297(+)